MVNDNFYDGNSNRGSVASILQKIKSDRSSCGNLEPRF